VDLLSAPMRRFVTDGVDKVADEIGEPLIWPSLSCDWSHGNSMLAGLINRLL